MTKRCKKGLSTKLSISSAKMAKMGKDGRVPIVVLERICDYMNCNIGDIMSFEKNDEEEGSSKQW